MTARAASDNFAADDDHVLPLPGLEPTPVGTSNLELAARRSLAALEAARVLTEAHALPMELVLSLSRVVGAAVVKGQAAAAAMAAAQLSAAFQLLPELDDAAGNGGDAWDALAAELREAADAERRRHQAQQ